MSPQEVLRFLEGVSLSPSLLATTPTSTTTRSTTVRSAAAGGRSGGGSRSGTAGGVGSIGGSGGGGVGGAGSGTGSLGGDVGIPLINGRALGVAYLEWLVSNDTKASLSPHTRRPPHSHTTNSSSSSGNGSGNSSSSSSGSVIIINGNDGGIGGVNGDGGTSNIHDEYAQLLMEGIPFDVDVENSHRGGGGGGGGGGGMAMWDVQESDGESLRIYKIYRRKLQHLLATSLQYNAERLLKILPPPFLHERALLLARLGRHYEVGITHEI